jgi:hypothetical protein
MNPVITLLSFLLVLAGLACFQWVNIYLGVGLFLAAGLASLSLKMASTW